MFRELLFHRRWLFFWFYLLLLINACDRQTSFHGIRKAGTQDNTPRMQDIEREFNAADVQTTSLVISKEKGTVGQNFALAASHTNALNYTQTQRDIITEQFKQGKDGATTTQEFPIQQIGELDLLIVMDNSATMLQYQNLIAPRLESLLSHMSNTNWAIRVVTTDSGCPVDTITAAEYAQDPAAVGERFATAINVGIEGDTSERGIEMAIKGLAGECATGNKPWLRADSAAAVLVISDEANCGSASNDTCTDAPLRHYGPSDFVDMTRAGTKFYGILYKHGPCTYDGYPRSEIHFPDDYFDVVAATNGIWDPICQNNYSQTLEKISADVSNTVKHEFELAHVPDQNSMVVKLDNAIITSGFTLNGSILTFDQTVVNNGQTIAVSYRYNSVPRHMHFTVRGNPANEHIQVKINGGVQSGSQYSFDLQSKKVSFNDMPPDDANIEVIYISGDKQLRKDFTVPGEALERTVLVKINGQKTLDYVLDLAAQKITFDPAPADAANISINYNKSEELVTEYPMPIANPIAVESFEVVDASTGEALTAELQDNKLIFPLDEVVPGRKIQATFYSQEKLPEQVSLAYAPIPDSVNISANANDDCLNSLQVVGRDLDITCDSDELAYIKIDYKYVEAMRTSFKVDGFISKNALWHVWVNDQTIEDFEVRKNVVSIPDQYLNHDSVVKIKVVENLQAGI